MSAKKIKIPQKRYRNKSLCKLHNKVAEALNLGKENPLTKAEALRHGRCPKPNAFKCQKTDCIQHV